MCLTENCHQLSMLNTFLIFMKDGNVNGGVHLWYLIDWSHLSISIEVKMFKYNNYNKCSGYTNVTKNDKSCILLYRNLKDA